MDDMNTCIKRINELYHLSQERALTPAEKEEQQFLRRKYVDAIKGNIRNQLNSITVQNPDGSKYSLKEKHDEKMVKVVDFPSKSALRQSMLKLRDTALATDRENWSHKIKQNITRIPEYENARAIFLYSSIGSEVDTDKLIDLALEDGKEVYLPKVVSDRHMEFYRIQSRKDLVKGAMGIMEPDGTEETLYEPEKKPEVLGDALFLLPGIAFDESGNRIGYGKAYYDRYLRRLRKLFRDKLPCYTIGICFELQKKPVIPAGEKDQKVDAICTEEKIYACN
ncbi:MAG: 5-formyltetrahydrofolate cyclo-ligase [Lachnospiraceae bacterium]|nr:5-formyltetrahydrofolate cyclo-ligase [Lachnospiraceae bacterium]